MYNWYSAPCTSGNGYDCGQNPHLQFIPTLWSNSSSLTSVWDSHVESALANGTKYLFSFNEPDACFSGSACMDVPSAVSAYKSYMQPYAGRAKIGAPAVTNAGAPMGLTWLSEFMGNCTGCEFDFINVHWYSNVYAGSNYFESFINSTRAVANGRPIFITEFALDSSYSFTDAQNQAFLSQVMAWADAQPDIAGYAYFMDATGLLMNSNGTAASPLGVLYDSYANTTVKGGLSL